MERSHSSADIAIPDIVTCRKCHAGNNPAANKAVSPCIACHGFHIPGHPPFAQQSSRATPTPTAASDTIADNRLQ